MPKEKRKSAGSSLRLSQKRHDTPIYSDVHVLGSETKSDFKRNKPYTVCGRSADRGKGSGEGGRERRGERGGRIEK
jgi:hypothetical protein